MNKIINKFAKKVSFALDSPLWKASNVVVGYIIAITLVVIFLVCWSFNQNVFIISLIWGISFLRLRFGTIAIQKTSVIVMWSIFCFGFSGIVLQALKIDNYLFLGAIVVGICAMYLYSYIPIWSAFLKYQKPDWGCDIDGHETKYNGCITSMLIYAITLFIVMADMTNLEDQKLTQQLLTESFEPVKLIKAEIINGHTVYILEAKGCQFAINPFEHPEVRKLNSTSQVKVILGGVDEHHLRIVKKIQFKN